MCFVDIFKTYTNNKKGTVIVSPKIAFSGQPIPMMLISSSSTFSMFSGKTFP